MLIGKRKEFRKKKIIILSPHLTKKEFPNSQYYVRLLVCCLCLTHDGYTVYTCTLYDANKYWLVARYRVKLT